MWGDFLKKAIANVEQFTHENSVKSSNDISTSNKSLLKKIGQSNRKPIQERLASIITNVQSATRLTENRSHASTDYQTICTDQIVQRGQKITYPIYETNEITENRLSRVFPASMPDFIKDHSINNVDLKDSSKNISSNYQAKKKNNFLSGTSISTNLDVSAMPINIRQIIDQKNKEISTLLEEGEKLSKKELKHMTIIKNLRSNIKKNEKVIIEMENKMKKSELEIAKLKEKLNHTSENNKLLSDRLNTMIKLETEYNTLKKEQNQSNFENNNISKNLGSIETFTNKSENHYYSEAMEIQQSKSSLSETSNISNINLTLLEKNHKLEVDTLHSLLEDQKTKFLEKEKDYIEEIYILEAKIETLRSNLEETSHIMNTNEYAKLLQQNETLHTQYLIAFENWKQKEDDLFSKNIVLKNENEKYLKIIHQESLKSECLGKKIESANEEIKDLKTKLSSNENIIKDTGLLNNALKEKVSKLEKTIVKMNAKHNEELKELEVSLKMQHSSQTKEQFELNDNNESEIPANISELNKLAKTLLIDNNSDLQEHLDIDSHKKIYPNTFFTENKSSCSLINSENNDKNNNNNSNSTNDNYSQNVEKSILLPGLSSPFDLPNYLNTSTSKAESNINIIQQLGSSVQRLERQLMIARDEINQITEQRDEARNECINLMIEVEKTKELQHKISILEKELEKINKRYEQCLELLGEKSEKEEELKQDIKDMKELYSQQIEELIKKLDHS
ncbi:hypothetical protein PCANB_000526 [Pneumocystis canis]|nr:hypothetical protein PCANB_000526 [Pneumocystis canis]